MILKKVLILFFLLSTLTSQLKAVGNYTKNAQLNVLVGKLKLRAAPVQGEILDTLRLGDQVRVLEGKEWLNDTIIDGINGRWVQVSCHGKTGYVYDGFLSYLPAPKADQYVEAYVTSLFKKIYADSTDNGKCNENSDFTESCMHSKQFFGKYNSITAYYADSYYYEGGSYTLTFTEVSIEEVYLLSKILESGTYKVIKDYMVQYPKEFKESLGELTMADMENLDHFAPNKNGEIKVGNSDGCYSMLTIKEIGSVVVMSHSGGC